MTRLRIGARATELGQGAASLTLPIGSAQLAEAFFRHDPPAPAELEAAIDAVEDALARLRTVLAEPVLRTSDAAVHALAAAAGAVDGMLTRDTVEAQFQRLASASLGHPGAVVGLPIGRDAAAVLLILRELMHHGGFGSVVAADPNGLA